MFAGGDEVNSTPDPRVNIPKLIEYYVSQGYNALEIKEMLPNLDMMQIESAVSQLGGSVNPAIASPGADEFQGGQGVIPIIPETVVMGERPEAPSSALNPMQVLSEIRGLTNARNNTEESINILKQENKPVTKFGIPVKFDGNVIMQNDEKIASLQQELSAIDSSLKNLQAISPDSSFIPKKLEMDPINVQPISADISMPPRVFEPEEKESISQAISLGQGELKLSNGEKRKVDAQTFSSYLNALSDSEIFALYNSADIVFSPDLDAILSQKAEGLIPGLMAGTDRGSITRRPSSFKALGEDYGRVSRGLIGNIGSAITSGIESAFVGPAEREVVESEYDSPLYGGGVKGFGRSVLVGGRSPGDVDSILKDISTPTDSIGEDLTILENTPTAVKAAAEEAPAEETVTEETVTEEVVAEEAPAEEVVAEEAAADKAAADKAAAEKAAADKAAADKAAAEEALTETKPEVVPAGDFQKAGNIFSSPNFIRFAANLSKGLATSEDMASGLAKGAALAAEERGLRDLEQQKLDQEVTLELIKSQGTTALKPSELKSLNAMATEMSDSIKNYEGTQSSIGIMNDAISMFEMAMDKKVPITGLPGRIARFKDEASAFMGIDNPNVSDATKIKNYIEQVKQRSIREILNESGRTISNLDRDIVDRVFGDLDLTGDPGEILKKLKNARQSLIINNKDKKRSIATNFEIIQNPAYGGVGVRAISPYFSLIQSILQSNITGSSKDVDLSSIVSIDLRDKDLFSIL